MSRLLGVGVSGFVFQFCATAATASNLLTPVAGPVTSEFQTLTAATSLPAPLVDEAPMAIRAGFPVGDPQGTAPTSLATTATGIPAPLLPTRGGTRIQPGVGSSRVSIDGVILRRPLGEVPAAAVPEPVTFVSALVGVVAVLVGRRRRAG